MIFYLDLHLKSLQLTKLCILLGLYLVSSNVRHFLLLLYVNSCIKNEYFNSTLLQLKFCGYVVKFNFVQVIIDYIYTIIVKNIISVFEKCRI